MYCVSYTSTYICIILVLCVTSRVSANIQQKHVFEYKKCNVIMSQYRAKPSEMCLNFQWYTNTLSVVDPNPRMMTMYPWFLLQMAGTPFRRWNPAAKIALAKPYLYPYSRGCTKYNMLMHRRFHNRLGYKKKHYATATLTESRMTLVLIHCGIVTPYCVGDLVQY